MSDMKILIIKTGALGDVVRTSFIAQALKDKYKFNKLDLYWLTDEKAKAFFVNNVYVDRIIAIQDKKEIANLKKVFFDRIINLEEGSEECKIASSLNHNKLIGAFINKDGKVDYTIETDYWFSMSLISKFGKKHADLLKKQNKKTHRQIIAEIIEIKNYKKYEPFLRLTAKQRDIKKSFIKRHNLTKSENIIGINTGSADRWLKQLPVKNTVELIDKLYKKFNAAILLFGGPNEIERNKEIIANSRSPVITTGCGNDLFEFPALISVCNLFITSDTLGLHLALALKRKTIVLIGPTSDTEIDMYELGEKVISKSKCVCCYKKDCKSMEKINLEEIIYRSTKLLLIKISLVITAFKEPKLQRAIESALNQKTKYKYDVIVAAPDENAHKMVLQYMKKNKNIYFFKDPGKGKSFALNLLFSRIKTDILILTDGDIYISENSVEEIMNLFKDSEIGCLSGRPVPQESKKTKYGYWANFLFDAAHKIRKKAFESNSFIECSGYLFAFRKNSIEKIPIDVSEDAVIPYMFWEKGYLVGYASKAEVYVKNTDNITDWIKQKSRTHKAHEKLNRYVDTITTPKVKSFKTESSRILWLLSYPSNLKELVWSIELAFARFYTWLKFFFDTHMFNRHYTDAWERIESTK